MPKLSATRGGKPGPYGCVTPATASAQIVRRNVQCVIPLGTGAVASNTKAVGIMPMAGKVTGIRFYGQAAVTGTSLTAEINARSTAGAAGNSLQSAATDIKFASVSAARTGVDAALTATTANLTLAANQMFEVVYTATSITAGPGDLVAIVFFVPTEDSVTSAGLTTTGADL